MGVRVVGTPRRAVIANAAGFVSVLAVQLLQVPLMLQFAGPARYGQFLILIALPSYLALSDLGLVAAASTRLTIAVAKDDGTQAGVFRGVWSSVLGACLLVALILGPLLASISPGSAFVTNAEAKGVLAAYVAYVLLLLCTNVVESAYRASGNFVEGAATIAASRLWDFGVAACLFVATTRLDAFTLGLAAGRVVALTWMIVRVRRLAPWASFRIAWPSRRAMAGLAGPSLASLALPVGNALLNQGLVLAVGAALGPVAVVTFTVCRTVANVLRQAVNVGTNAILPLVTSSLARGDLLYSRHLLKRTGLGLVALCSCAVVGAGFLARPVISLWTGGAVEFPPLLLGLLLLATSIDAAWLILSLPRVATNTHGRIAVFFTISSGAVVALAVPVADWVGLPGLALLLVLQSAAMVVWTHLSRKDWGTL